MVKRNGVEMVKSPSGNTEHDELSGIFSVSGWSDMSRQMSA